MLLSASVLLWLPLALAIMAGFTRYHRVSWGLLIITLLSALGSGYLTFVGAGIICVGFALAYLAANGQSHWRTTAWVALLLWCLALFLHWLPGFSNLTVLDKVIASAHSTPFSLYLNLDKPLVFFALLLAFPTLLGHSKTPNIKATLLSLVPLFALLPIAVWLGALAFEWSLPEWWWIFALNNLLFTCVAEEALFRGLIQQKAQQQFGAIAGLLIASALFGMAHFSGGPLLMIFAALAGLGYGLVFHFTGRLWVSVGVHFLFNFAHLLFFTYPMLAR
ncbi:MULTISPECIES: CPBP family intramembrane glutamic endopeptidase [Vibrio]|uniref:CPBP family intramembrane metalloprotease n=1 Tax=Vibrio cholerae TaxID=666 RepID=A0A5C9SW05_VIBCL|nr:MULTISPECIES: CPBP family intramembrane glutamic endopeptidase [Vibrio]EKG85568.1 CAAX amino terminal protease family protein [Vibrio paracholerae HE-16]MBW5429886.1 CPBP family intramembrane metalloprotease [Vibrio cholerae]MCO7016761.1 CPBP family intramembrane metalloprotease [Vibrio paracholerae]MCO7018703.1 CPBP family intramembrane metalloprotease [Vibrio paracholerae]MCO7028946.1 CPBP family intramembrane metalloprotease [Vibrio paracholerae]